MPSDFQIQIAQQDTVCAKASCGKALPKGSQIRVYPSSLEKAYCADAQHSGARFPQGAPAPAQSVGEVPQTPPEGREQRDDGVWGYRERDLLMARESAVKGTVAIYAACIQTGIFKNCPTQGEIVAYAEALDNWIREAIEAHL